MKDQGTRIIIYNLWEDGQGLLELDFDSDIHVSTCFNTMDHLFLFGHTHGLTTSLNQDMNNPFFFGHTQDGPYV